MEFRKLLFLTLFASIWCVINAYVFMPKIVGNRLVLFRVAKGERSKLTDSVEVNDKIRAPIVFKNSFKTPQISGQKIGHKSESYEKEDIPDKAYGSNEHNLKKSKKIWTEKSKNDHGLKAGGSYSSKVGRDKHGSSYSDSGYRSHYSRDKGPEFKKLWSRDKERGLKNSYGKNMGIYGSHEIEDKDSQHGLKKWSADDSQNQGWLSNHKSHNSGDHNRKADSRRTKTNSDVKWDEESDYSSEDKQSNSNVHKSSPNGRYESESDDRNVHNDQSEHQDSEISQIMNDRQKEVEHQYDDYVQNNRYKFNEEMQRTAQIPQDNYKNSHNPEPEYSPAFLHSPESTYDETSARNPQNHKRHQTYDGHYRSSSTVSEVPKSDSEKWRVNSDESSAQRKPETNEWSYVNREDDHKNNNKPVIKSWTNDHRMLGYSYTVTHKPTVNYGSGHFANNNNPHSIDH